MKQNSSAEVATETRKGMTTNDKLSMTLFFMSLLVIFLGSLAPVFSGANPPFGPALYRPTPTYLAISIMATIVLGGYFIVTDISNFVRKRMLGQNPIAYHAKAGKLLTLGGYIHFLPRLMQSFVGGIVILLFVFALRILLAWFVFYAGLAGILVAFGYRTFVTIH